MGERKWQWSLTTDRPPAHPPCREDELGLPKSTMHKSIKTFLPVGMRISGDATDLALRCCNEFVQLLSTQARRCRREGAAASSLLQHVVCCRTLY